MDKNYFDDYKGIAHSGSVRLDAGVAQKLPDEACRFVILNRWNVTDDEQFTNVTVGDVLSSNDEVYYGFDGVLAAQLFPGQSTILMPISNLNQITLKRPAKTSSATVWFTYFK